jgi:hypothetical protein
MKFANEETRPKSSGIPRLCPYFMLGSEALECPFGGAQDGRQP